MTALVNPAASPGWLSGALVPQFKTVDIVPRTRLRSGASTATAAVQRYGPQATSAAAPTRMNGPGGTVGNPSTPEKYSIVIPAAATTMPTTFTLAGVESSKSLPIINLFVACAKDDAATPSVTLRSSSGTGRLDLLDPRAWSQPETVRPQATPSPDRVGRPLAAVRGWWRPRPWRRAAGRGPGACRDWP